MVASPGPEPSVTREEIDFLYDPHRDRYRGVFPWKGKWMAQVREDGRDKYLGMYRLPREAASRVVVYLRDRYGEGWRSAAGGRSGHRVPWRIKKRLRGVYVVDVWVAGRPVRVTSRLVRCTDGAVGDGWATTADAHRARKEFQRVVRRTDRAGGPVMTRIRSSRA